MGNLTPVLRPVRGLLRVAAAVLVVAVASPVYAADVYDLAKQDVWVVGDIVTTTVVERDVQELKFVEADGKAVGKPASEIVVEARLIERCLAIDAAGNRVRTLVYVVSWSAADGTAKDTSLAGAVLDVTGSGRTRVARVASSREDLTKSASAWLGRRYGGGRPDPASARAYWLPKAPVAVGDVWSADLSAFLDAMAAGTRLDRSKTTSTCTLTSVEKSVALVTCEGSLPLASFPGKEAGKVIPWKSGGTQLVKGTISIGLGGRVAPFKGVFASSLAGEAEMGGKSVSLVMKKDQRIDIVVGGEWPPTIRIPEPEAPAVPVPAPAVPPEGPAMGAMGM